jgi:NAD(P)-dependent dehydrogenase (short-subunit alcohol dehydrogenase family)
MLSRSDEEMAQQQIALVTGANRGIGFEICRQRSKLGVRVILGSRDAAKGLGAAAKLIAEHLPVEARELDVANDESIEACMDWIRRDPGHLDTLVNNAGIMVEDDDADPEQEGRRAWEFLLIRSIRVGSRRPWVEPAPVAAFRRVLKPLYG